MTVVEIEERIKSTLNAVHLEIEDDSDLHRGHSGNRSGGGHYRALIVAECFNGLSTLNRHKKVYELFAGKLGSEIHALSLKTLTPQEWKS